MSYHFWLGNDAHAAALWVKVSDRMPPKDVQVLVRLKEGSGGVCDVACYIGRREDGDRWILADVMLESRQITHWAAIGVPA